MKRKSAILGLSLALALSGLWSCEKGIGETDKIEAGNTVNLTLKSDLSDQTRTSISYDETSGKYKPAWEAEEHIGVFVGENKNKDFKNSGAGQSTQFNGNVSLTAGTYKVYTYYPYYGKTSSDNTPSDTRIELPSVQKPTLESFDGAADIMVGYPLDLTLSADEARAMGVHTDRLRLAVILSATVLTAAAVSVSGMIGWVGLVIPHLSRRIVGNDCRWLLPMSMLFGAAFLLLVDNMARCLTAVEIPIGILTAFVGAPFFIYLMIKGGDRV